MRILSVALFSAATLALVGGAQAADMVLKAAPLEAAPPVSGYLGLYVGGDSWRHGVTDISDPASRGTAFVYGGEGRLNYWLSSVTSFQVDVEAEGTTRYRNLRGGNIGNVNDDGRIAAAFGGHWSWRNQNHLLGVFGGLTYANNLGEEGSMNHAFVGVEGQLYLNSVTLYGQAGGAWAIGSPASGEDIPTDIWFLRGVGRWFATPNDKLQAEVGYARLTKAAHETPSVSDGNVLNWGASYEHRLSIPISLFAAYDGYRFRSGHNCGNRATNNVFTVGARFIFNQNTLLSNDRKGATLDMPKFNRVFPWTDNVNDNFSCQLT